MSRFLIKSTMTSNRRGQVGGWLLVTGPIIGVIAWTTMPSISAAASDYFNGAAKIGLLACWAAIAFGLIAPFSGLVMLMTGRDYAHEVEVLPDN